MTNYLIEFALIHILLFGVYQLFLRGETQLAFLRRYLLVSLILALLLPVIKISTVTPISGIDISGSVTTMLLPEIDASIPSELRTAANTYQWLIWVFAFGAVIASIRLIIACLQINLIYRKSIPMQLHGRLVMHKRHLKTSFTFFKWIFIDKDYYDNTLEIIHHEEAHIKYGHSYELLLGNILTIPFWWLPSIWLCIREFKRIHEYQADAYALSVSTKGNYINVLVDSTLKDHGMKLVNSFHDCPINDRLSFIKKLKKKINPWKMRSIIALLAITIITFSCEDKLETDITSIVEHDNTVLTYSNEVEQKLKELQTKNPKTEFKIIQIKGDQELLSELNFEGLKFIEVLPIDEQNVTVTIIVMVKEFKYKIKVPKSLPQVFQESDVIFKVVDEPPKFPGGMSAFYEYIGEHIHYPQEAVNIGIEGKVFVQFVVGKEGEITDVLVVKGIGAGCDNEALRAVKNSPPWIPGKQRGESVKVRMILPIVFKLPAE